MAKPTPKQKVARRKNRDTRTAEKDQRKIAAAKAADGREKSKGLDFTQHAIRIVRESTEEK